MNPIIAVHLDEIRDLCREYGMQRLEAFGSINTSDSDPERSNMDFLETNPEGYGFGPWFSRLQELEDRLVQTLGRDVDLVMSTALKHERFRRLTDQTRQVIYNASEDHAFA